MTRQANRLTPVQVRNAKKDVCDGYGLWLQVSRYGTRSWLFRFMIDGKADSMGLGPMNTTSLAKARERAQRARDLLQEGINPREHRDDEHAKRKAEAAKALTFKQCADGYIKANRAAWKNEKHAAQWASTFNGATAATAAINDLPVASIDTGLVVKVLQPIWYETPETASRVRARLERVLAWATVAGYRTGDNPARWTGHLKELLPAKTKIASVEHHDAIPYRDMGAFMAELRTKKGTPARALEFAILTATRTGEVIGARWSEIDLDDELWTVPGERMKAGREHRIPLSDRAVAILDAIRSDGEFVFPREGGTKPLHGSSMWEVVKRMRDDATTHGFRATFRDWAAEQTSYPNELCEVALAHAVGNKVEAAYRRGDMMEKRRRLMADWAAYCEQTPAKRASTVTPIREAVR
jgi:integrase